MAAGRIKEARTLAEVVLRTEATSGEANLTMARILVRAGEPSGAVAFYQRAALGHWPDAAGSEPHDASSSNCSHTTDRPRRSSPNCWPCNVIPLTRPVAARG